MARKYEAAQERPRPSYVPLKPSERDELQAIADQEGRSLGGQIRFFTLRGLENHREVSHGGEAA